MELGWTSSRLVDACSWCAPLSSSYVFIYCKQMTRQSWVCIHSASSISSGSILPPPGLLLLLILLLLLLLCLQLHQLWPIRASSSLCPCGLWPGASLRRRHTTDTTATSLTSTGTGSTRRTTRTNSRRCPTRCARCRSLQRPPTPRSPWWSTRSLKSSTRSRRFSTRCPKWCILHLSPTSLLRSTCLCLKPPPRSTWAASSTGSCLMLGAPAAGSTSISSSRKTLVRAAALSPSPSLYFSLSLFL